MTNDIDVDDDQMEPSNILGEDLRSSLKNTKMLTKIKKKYMSILVTILTYCKIMITIKDILPIFIPSCGLG